MTFINSKSITAILDSLNLELKASKVSRDLRVFGSGALMLLNIAEQTRETVDLDMLSPTGDMDLLRASEAVATKHGLDNEWLNSMGSRFVKYLPVQWEARLKLVYSGSNLKVYSLSREDLLLTKAKAFYNRDERDDLEDLLALSNSLEEIEKNFKEHNFSDKERLEAVLSRVRGAYEKL